MKCEPAAVFNLQVFNHIPEIETQDYTIFYFIKNIQKKNYTIKQTL